jgi:membrane peptidoglycan carboxypeptidase
MQTSLARRQRQRRSGNGRRNGGGTGSVRALAVALPLFLFASLAVLALTGFLAVVGAYGFYSRDLPDPKQVFDNLAFNQQTIVYDSTGKVELARFGDERREVVPYDQIPPLLIDATTSIEDKTFWTNAGFDPAAFVKAGFDTLTGNERGASTITQQLVRARLLPESAFAGSKYERKIKEIIQSIRLTQAYPGDAGKQSIIAAYLNQNFYGNQSYGIKAAAKSYFGITDLTKLTIAQAAVLAAIPKSPSTYDLAKNAVQMKGSDGKTQLIVPSDTEIYQRRDQVLNQMLQNRYLTRDTITDAQIEAAKADPIILVPQATPNWRAPHFVWQVRRELGTILCGAEQAESCDRLDTGGYRVITTLDWNMQKTAEKWVKAAVLAPNATNTKAYLKSIGVPDQTWIENLRGKNVHNGALVAIDYRTGRILAYVGSASYYASSKDPTFQPQFDVLSDGWRQPGSAMKPINYITGIDDRTMTAATLFMDVVTDFGGKYTPTDADRLERGPVRMRQALQFSLNIPAVKAAIMNGPDHVFEEAKKFGLRFQAAQNVAGSSIALGTLEIHPTDLVGAYGAIANGGVLMPRTTISSVVDSSGTQIWPQTTNQPAGVQVASPQAAFVVTDMLAGNTDPRQNPYWGKFQILAGGTRRPAALKTGTTNDTKDLAAYGFLAPPADPAAPALAVGVWMGNSDNSQTGGVFSLDSTAPLWQAFLTEASKGMPVASFQEPGGIVQARVDAFSGMLPGPFTTKTVNEYFIDGTVPTRVDDTKVGVQIDSASGDLWAEGCAGPPETQGFLDLSGVDAGFPTWQKADAGWIVRAQKGVGVAGGPEKTRTAYFYDGSYAPYGRTWGAPFPPTTTCTPPPPEPSIQPCDPLLGPCPTPCDPTLGPCPTPCDPLLGPCPTPCDPTLGPCPTATPAAQVVIVGDLRCQTLEQVAGSLTANGLAIGTISPNAPGPTWVVARQRPAAGTVVSPGTPVDITLADPKKTGCG